MSGFPRYAIYFAPDPRCDLWRFGARLLGYDAHAGIDLRFPEEALRVAPDWEELSADPRKYGFHATLKAPLPLAPGKTEAELVSACASFAAKARPVPVIRPTVDAISGFLAIVPAERSGALEQLAAGCVRDFDAFRAPLSDADRERRNPSQLTSRQRTYLDQWGYPYVMEEFRFHMTLTGRLNEARRGPILDMLRAGFAKLKLTTLAIDRIALFRQESRDARFAIARSWQLRGE
jgi:putative phosphonate metabolism protein